MLFLCTTRDITFLNHTSRCSVYFLLSPSQKFFQALSASVVPSTYSKCPFCSTETDSSVMSAGRVSNQCVHNKGIGDIVISTKVGMFTIYINTIDFITARRYANVHYVNVTGNSYIASTFMQTFLHHPSGLLQISRWNLLSFHPTRIMIQMAKIENTLLSSLQTRLQKNPKLRLLRNHLNQLLHRNLSLLSRASCFLSLSENCFLFPSYHLPLILLVSLVASFHFQLSFLTSIILAVLSHHLMSIIIDGLSPSARISFITSPSSGCDLFYRFSLLLRSLLHQLLFTVPFMTDDSIAAVFTATPVSVTTIVSITKTNFQCYKKYRAQTNSRSVFIYFYLLVAIWRVVKRVLNSARSCSQL